MKKAFLLFGFLVAGFAVSAQDEFKSFKPKKNDVTTELGLAGGLNNADFKLNEGGSGLLRFRYFIKEDLAARVGFNLSASSEKTNFYGTGANAGRTGKLVEKSTGFLLNLGIEKHFGGTPRLSPYVGADILFGISGRKDKGENTDGEVFVSQFNYTVKGPGTFSLGLRGVVGADYYIAKHLYIGAEAGLGFLYSREGQTKTTTTINNVTATTIVESPGSEFELQPSVITGIRIGFVF
jgi:outer membrane protein W